MKFFKGNGNTKISIKVVANFEFENITNTFSNPFIKPIGEENNRFGNIRIFPCERGIN